MAKSRSQVSQSKGLPGSSLDKLSQATSLAPGLLIAMPQMDDPSFERAVILMISHNEDHSLGIIINQPTEILTHDLLAGLDLSWNGDRLSRVHRGGPVRENVGMILHSPTDTIGSDKPYPVMPGIALSPSTDLLRQLAMHPPEHMVFYLGHSAWGAGQLAAEVAQGSWLFADASSQLLFETPSSLMWERAMESIGIAAPESLAHVRGIN